MYIYIYMPACCVTGACFLGKPIFGVFGGFWCFGGQDRERQRERERERERERKKWKCAFQIAINFCRVSGWVSQDKCLLKFALLVCNVKTPKHSKIRIWALLHEVALHLSFIFFLLLFLSSFLFIPFSVSSVSSSSCFFHLFSCLSFLFLCLLCLLHLLLFFSFYFFFLFLLFCVLLLVWTLWLRCKEEFRLFLVGPILGFSLKPLFS